MLALVALAGAAVVPAPSPAVLAAGTASPLGPAPDVLVDAAATAAGRQVVLLPSPMPSAAVATLMAAATTVPA